jgi:hypothetical protein
MAEFKAHMLERFIGTDEGEVTEYLGCEHVRDRKARTGQLIQAGYVELRSVYYASCGSATQLLRLWTPTCVSAITS